MLMQAYLKLATTLLVDFIISTGTAGAPSLLTSAYSIWSIVSVPAACASLTEPGDRVLVIDNGIFGKGFADFVKTENKE